MTTFLPELSAAMMGPTGVGTGRRAGGESLESQGYQTVATVGEIPEGEGRPFVVGGRPLAVFLDGGMYYAVDDVCPHKGLPLHDGIVCERSVTCLAHDWRFDLADGSWFENPDVRLGTYPVRVVGDEVQVDAG